MRISDWSSDVCSSDLRVSLSTIPSDFIDRVEIITGGTSSIYGSDAVAGVVNIITKRNERGLTLRARTGVTAEGDGQELTLGATWGARFAGGRGYLLVSGTDRKSTRLNSSH